MIYRVSLKNIAASLLGLLILLYIYNLNQNKNINVKEDERSELSIQDISCVLNREVAKNIGIKQSSNKKIHCKTDGSEVYVPFSFIKHYYEARGELVSSKSVDKIREFEISHSYSRVYTPSSPYQSSGQFMHFRSFNVEARSRVLCLSASAGVPVTTQWDQRGYFYPTQIAQFALSHYSSHLAAVKSNNHRTYIEGGGERADLDNTGAARVVDDESQSLVIEFKDKLVFYINSPHLILSFDFKNLVGAGFKIILKVDNRDEVVLNYLPVNEHLTVKNGEAVFGLGTTPGDWIKITRDIANDLDKVNHLLNKKLRSNNNDKKMSAGSLRISSLVFHGHGLVTNISVSDEEHLRLFLHAADWFINNQDQDTGGWATPVIFNKDRKKYPGAEEVESGWYGAMCQGQAMSVLVRAYLKTGDEKYLRSAEAGVRVFNLSSGEGGVRAVFMNKYVWYEEYPTNPPSFILNGFMYSLLGLYDVKSVSTRVRKQATQLYKSGIESLAAMLPLYDSGFSTFYDLRHFTMKTAPKVGNICKKFLMFLFFICSGSSLGLSLHTHQPASGACNY